jgi:hypothetical protein
LATFVGRLAIINAGLHDAVREDVCVGGTTTGDSIDADGFPVAIDETAAAAATAALGTIRWPNLQIFGNQNTTSFASVL